MKELSIEEKAKAYDKKLAEAKEVLKDGGISQNTIDYIQKLYPELVEPEGERIRKDIISYLALYKDAIGEEYESWIAWLEKQGKQKPYASETMNEKGDFDNGFTRMMKKEQKPADKVEHKFNVGDIIRLKGTAVEYTIRRVTDTTYYTDGWSCGIERCEEDYELVEQNPAWSEEDEINLGKAMWYVENPAPMVAKDSMLVEWLKNLRGRVQTQPKQEWSEEDENRLSDAVFFVREYQIPTRDKRLLNAAKEAEEWLKSLRPKSQWKPSDEQMKALDDVISSRDIRYDVLSELWKDLNKLK